MAGLVACLWPRQISRPRLGGPVWEKTGRGQRRYGRPDGGIILLTALQEEAEVTTVEEGRSEIG